MQGRWFGQLRRHCTQCPNERRPHRTAHEQREQPFACLITRANKVTVNSAYSSRYPPVLHKAGGLNVHGSDDQLGPADQCRIALACAGIRYAGQCHLDGLADWRLGLFRGMRDHCPDARRRRLGHTTCFTRSEIVEPPGMGKVIAVGPLCSKKQTRKTQTGDELLWLARSRATGRPADPSMFHLHYHALRGETSS